LSQVPHSENIDKFRNSLVASGMIKKLKKNNSLDDYKLTQSERDFSSSSDSIVMTNIILSNTEIKKDIMKKDFMKKDVNRDVIKKDLIKRDVIKKDLIKKEEKITDFEKRKLKLQERLKFNFDKLFLTIDNDLAEIKENFKYEKEIHGLINGQYKKKGKIYKRNVLLDYCKINLKYFVKDYLMTEEEKIHFNSDLFVIKRRVALQEIYSEYLKRKYLNIGKETEIFFNHSDMVKHIEKTLFENFNIDNDITPTNFNRGPRHRRNTLARHVNITKGIFNYNKKYMNFYLHKDIEYNSEDEYIDYYSDTHRIKKMGKNKFTTQQELLSVQSGDYSNSSTNYNKIVNLKADSGTMLRCLNRQTSKKGMYSQCRDFSLHSNKDYMNRSDLKKCKRSERRLVEIRSQNTSLVVNREENTIVIVL
jgi:pentapeptide MXKDX repeat protein